ncbi:MAG TPA: hypothetical protein ENJ40_02940 [Thermosulfurimonas dismutans]|uniref:Uncharacterized protein n=1 Tax=Thermosulfurimonas dismutans TaxID=999894 RepID=A0A7C3GSA7_9BACT|nr:hypothetical protein [Thermosulfurimonas sp.]HFC97402.1 hypothetical protein [Thermosulfurimonas dismutans]
MDPKLLESLKRKVQQELVNREREVLEYWLAELEKVYRKKHQTLAELKSELNLLMEKMRKRLSVIQTKGI